MNPMIRKPIPVARATRKNSRILLMKGQRRYSAQITFLIRLRAFLDEVGGVLDELPDGVNDHRVDVTHVGERRETVS